MRILENLFGDDIVIGDFKASDYGLVLASFDYNGTEENNLALSYEVIEAYIGRNPVPAYLGSRYQEKLKPTITLIKAPYCVTGNTMEYFTEHECRYILRELTGFDGYRWMQVYHNDLDELLFFNVHVTAVRYMKINQQICGIIMDLECDSPYAWSQEFLYSYTMEPGKTLTFYNTSDELTDYLYPIVTISSTADIAPLRITNQTDNNRITEIKSLKKNITVTMDSKRELLTIPGVTYPLDQFNFKWFRLVNGKNIISTNYKIDISFRYRVARKVGFITI